MRGQRERERERVRGRGGGRGGGGGVGRGGVGSTIEGSSGGKGSSLNDMSDVGPIRAGGRKRMRVESEEEEEEEESGEGGFGSVVRSRVRRGGWGLA